MKALAKKKWLIAGGAAVAGVGLTAFLLSRKPKPPPPPTGTFLFMDTYEDEPTITKTTHDLWMEVIKDTKKGDYWADNVHWLECAKSAEKKYAIDPEMGNAKLASLAHNGSRSVEVEVASVPSEYTYVSALLARYFRTQSLIADALYDVGCWFYVPKGNIPIVVFGMENHPSWVTQYFAYAGIQTEDGSIFVMDKNQMLRIGNVDFQFDSWFKLWLVWDIRQQNFELHYKSRVEERKFAVNWVWVSNWNVAYIGYRAFNFYAGAGNTSGSKQKFYVDDFYAQVVGNEGKRISKMAQELALPYLPVPLSKKR